MLILKYSFIVEISGDIIFGRMSCVDSVHYMEGWNKKKLPKRRFH